MVIAFLFSQMSLCPAVSQSVSQSITRSITSSVLPFMSQSNTQLVLRPPGIDILPLFPSLFSSFHSSIPHYHPTVYSFYTFTSLHPLLLPVFLFFCNVPILCFVSLSLHHCPSFCLFVFLSFLPIRQYCFLFCLAAFHPSILHFPSLLLPPSTQQPVTSPCYFVISLDLNCKCIKYSTFL